MIFGKLFGEPHIPLHALLLMSIVGLIVGCQTEPTPPRLPLPATPQPITTEKAMSGEFSAELILLEQGNLPDSSITAFQSDRLASETLFRVPENGWLNQLAQQPTTGRLLVAYSPPDDDGSLSLDRSGLYWLDDGELTPLLLPDAPNIYFYTPTFSADGQTIFFVESIIRGGGIQNLDVTLIRYDLVTQMRTPLDKDGIWPRLSPNGEWIVYVHVEPETLQRSLVVIRPNGTDRRTLIPAGRYFDLDTPIFAPDSNTIFFTVARYAEETRSIFDLLMGIKTAHAHVNQNIPSAWWKIEMGGGEEVQISAEHDIVLHGSFANDQLYFSTVTGLYTLNTVTNEVKLLAASPAFRTVLIAVE